MQVAKRTKVCFTAKDILAYCAKWKSWGEWRQFYHLNHKGPTASRLATSRHDKMVDRFHYMMRHADFEDDAIADRCAILQWLQTMSKTQAMLPLWIYYKVAPPEEQLTFFRRWINSRKGAWPRKWDDIFAFVNFNSHDNPGFLWFMLFETLKEGLTESWLSIATQVSHQLRHFTEKELQHPDHRYAYYWKIRKMQRMHTLTFPRVRRWHSDPAAMVLHERKYKYLIKYLMVVGDVKTPVAESVYFCFPPLKPDEEVEKHFDLEPKRNH